MMLFETYFRFSLFHLFFMVHLVTSRPQYKWQVNSNSSEAVIEKNMGFLRILTRPENPTSVEFVEDHDIIFPDSYEDTVDFVPRIEGTPKCAKSNTYCEEIESYPYGHLKDILKKTNTPTGIFGTDEASDEISNRLGEQETTFLCRAKDKIIFPKVGKTKSSKWKYIINQGHNDGYIQGVRVEICDHLDSPCDIISYLPIGYTTSCKQKFMYRRMISLSEKGHPFTDTFEMPSACCCSYRRDSHFLARFGLPVTSLKRKL